MPPCPAPDTCWLYLVRHGATDNNRAEPPRLQGRRTDPPLSQEGLEQAGATGRFLSAVSIEAVYSSPLRRAHQTAEAIAEPHGLEVRIVDELVEADVGLWEGRSWEEIQRNDPEAYQAFMDDASVHPYLGGETIRAVFERSSPALLKLLADNPGRRIVAVAHNAVNRAFLAHLLGMAIARYRLVPQDNCGLTLVRYRKGGAKAVTINGVFHLG